MKRSALAGWLGLVLFAAALVPWSPATAQSGAEMRPDDAARVATRAGGRVNVRGGPTTRDNVVGQVGADEAVTIQAAQRQGSYVWYEVRTAAGLTGWIRGDLLEPAAVAPAVGVAPVAPATPVPATPTPPPAAAVADDWTRYIPGLLQPVDACINSLSLQPVVVTRVFQVEPDMVGVRLRDPSHRRWECLITRDGNYPIRLDPLADRVRPMPGDGNPIFLRMPADAPVDPCLQVTQVADPVNGRVIGWRAFDTCHAAGGIRP